MKLGVYTAVMHDRSLRDALSTISSLGLVGAHINAGGSLPTPHLPVEGLLAGRVDPEDTELGEREGLEVAAST